MHEEHDPKLSFPWTLRTQCTHLTPILLYYSVLRHPIQTSYSSFGREWISNCMHAHGIEHIRMSVYNPSENGLVEVFNHILKFGVQIFQTHSQTSQPNCLQQSCASQPWKEGILELLKAFRAMLPKLGAKSPAECFFRLDFQVLKK